MTAQEDLTDYMRAKSQTYRQEVLDPEDDGHYWARVLDILSNDLAALPDDHPELRALATVWDLEGTSMLDENMTYSELVLRPATPVVSIWLPLFVDAFVRSVLGWHLDEDPRGHVGIYAAFGEPTVALAAIPKHREMHDEMERHAIHRARAAGMPWPRIADLLQKPLCEVVCETDHYAVNCDCWRDGAAEGRPRPRRPAGRPRITVVHGEGHLPGSPAPGVS